MQRFTVHSDTLGKGQRAQSKPQRAGNTKLSPFFLYVRISTDSQCAPHTQPASALGSGTTLLIPIWSLILIQTDSNCRWPRNNMKHKTPKNQNVETWPPAQKSHKGKSTNMKWLFTQDFRRFKDSRECSHEMGQQTSEAEAFLLYSERALRQSPLWVSVCTHINSFSCISNLLWYELEVTLGGKNMTKKINSSHF